MHTQQINSFLTFIQSQESSRHFLQRCYQHLDGIDADVKSYQNCNTFMGYLEHGLLYYKQANELDLFLKPLLHFYGMSHLLKACILAVRPNYPESAGLLAHGVSSRKRKKKAYTFLDDEVGVQTKGLFPYVSTHLFHLQQMPFAKVKMDTLLRNIPELVPFYTWQGGASMVRVGQIDSQQIQIPKYLLDSHQATEQAIIRKIQRHLPEMMDIETVGNHYNIKLAEKMTTESGPFSIQELDQGIYFPVHREHSLSIPEVLIHYLLLYNLSMLSRYEPAWWRDLLTTRPDLDYPLVSGFMDCTAIKTPLVLGRFLHGLYMKET